MGPWLILGVAALGAAYAFRGELGLGQIFGGGTARAPKPTPAQRDALSRGLNQRTAGGVSTRDVTIDRTIIDVERPAYYGVLGCCRAATMAARLPDGRREAPGSVERSMPFQRPPWSRSGQICGCRPPSDGRPWWNPVLTADRHDRRDLMPDVEWAAGTPGYARPTYPDKVAVRGFDRDGVAWVLTSATRNFAKIGGVTRQGGFPLLIFVSLDGWTAFRSDTGTGVREGAVQLTYAGAPLEPNANPWDVEPWTAYGDGTERVPPGNGSLWRDENDVLPYDWIAPAVAHALTRKGYVRLPDAKVSA